MTATTSPLDKAHWVLATHNGKRPTGEAWQKPDNKPSHHAVRKHMAQGETVGVMPYSLDCVVIDIDTNEYEGQEGDKALAEVRALLNIEDGDSLALPSLTPGRYHLWCRAAPDWPPGNKAWTLERGQGELRFNAGYVAMHGGEIALKELAAWLKTDARPIGLGAWEALMAATAKRQKRNAKTDNKWRDGNRNNQANREMFLAAKHGEPLQPIADKARAAGLPESEVKDLVAHAGADGRAARKAEAEVNGVEMVITTKTADGLGAVMDAEGWQCRYNTRSEREEIDLGDDVGWQTWTPRLDLVLRERVALVHRLAGGDSNTGKGALRFTVDGWASARSYLCSLTPVDPVKQWLLSLPQTAGADHILNAFSLCFRHRNDEYSHWIIKAMWLGTVERIMEPGCPQRVMPVLLGDQDTGKSSFVRHMLPPELEHEYFQGQLTLGGDPQERLHSTMGVVLAECAELSGSRKVSPEEIKAQLDLSHDRARPKYERVARSIPRGYYTVGTANRTNALPADDANSRYAVLDVERGERQAHEVLSEVRADCWRQALNAWQRGERMGYLPANLKVIQRQANQAYDQIDEVLKGKIADLPAYQGWAKIEAVMAAIGADSYPPRQVGVALRAAGFVGRQKQFAPGLRPNVWRHPHGDPNSDRLLRQIDWREQD